MPVQEDRQGPLAGIKIIEMAGLGPVPLAGLMLSEMGATVLRIERMSSSQAFLKMPPQYDLDRHGRSILKLDLKRDEGKALLGRLAVGADVLVEGFRPGVMERLGLGPDAALATNPRLVYGRMTGFGHEGPLAERAGHDLTYLAYTGVLHAIGHKDERPVPPLNLVADYGGGTMFLISGLLAALFARERTGKGQVVDAAMIDGASMLAAPFFAFMAGGWWQDIRGDNLLDSGTPFYDTYETADGRHVAVACLEPQFFAEFARLLPLDERFASSQYDRRLWPDMREAIAARLRERTRDEWAALFEPTDACVAPVLSLTEALRHPHNVARGVHRQVAEMKRPGPAPRLSESGARLAGPACPALDDPALLSSFGIDETEIAALESKGLIGK